MYQGEGLNQQDDGAVVPDRVWNAGRQVGKPVRIEGPFRQKAETPGKRRREFGREANREITLAVAGHIPLVRGRDVQARAAVIGIRLKGGGCEAVRSRDAVVLRAVAGRRKLQHGMVAIGADAPDVKGSARRPGNKAGDQQANQRESEKAP